MKTPYRDGTKHVIFEPLDFIAKLAALVAAPRANLTGFHGVFEPNSRYRGRAMPGRRGRVSEPESLAEEPTPAERRAPMTWAQRLKRVSGIDAKTCRACGGAVRIIVCIEDPHVIKKILTLQAAAGRLEKSRSPSTGIARAVALPCFEILPWMASRPPNWRILGVRPK